METSSSLRDALERNLRLDARDSFTAEITSKRTGESILFRFERRFDLSFGGFGTSGYSVSVYDTSNGGRRYDLGFVTWDAPYSNEFSLRPSSSFVPEKYRAALAWAYANLVRGSKSSPFASVRAVYPA